jgi:hypothetical protein
MIEYILVTTDIGKEALYRDNSLEIWWGNGVEVSVYDLITTYNLCNDDGIKLYHEHIVVGDVEEFSFPNSFEELNEIVDSNNVRK